MNIFSRMAAELVLPETSALANLWPSVVASSVTRPTGACCGYSGGWCWRCACWCCCAAGGGGAPAVVQLVNVLMSVPSMLLRSPWDDLDPGPALREPLTAPEAGWAWAAVASDRPSGDAACAAGMAGALVRSGDGGLGPPVVRQLALLGGGVGPRVLGLGSAVVVEGAAEGAPDPEVKCIESERGEPGEMGGRLDVDGDDDDAVECEAECEICCCCCCCWACGSGRGSGRRSGDEPALASVAVGDVYACAACFHVSRSRPVRFGGGGGGGGGGGREGGTALGGPRPRSAPGVVEVLTAVDDDVARSECERCEPK